VSTTRDRLEDLARDLDMVVFRLEREPTGPPPEVDRVLAERRRLRRDLEGLRDRLEELARGM
jgi:transposase